MNQTKKEENTNKISTVLIAPPHFSLFPTVGIPQLVAYIQSKGHNIKQKLIDSQIYNDMLSPKELSKIFRKIRDSLLPKIKENNDLNENIEKDLKSYGKSNPLLEIFQVDISNGNILQQILEREEILTNQISEAAISMQKNFVTAGIQNMMKNFGLMDLGMRLISLAYYPTIFEPLTGIEMRYNPYLLSDVKQAIENKEENFLIEYFKQNLYPWLMEEQPKIIGIQINHENQFIPAFTVLNYIKKELPNSYIILGGTLISYLRDQLVTHEGYWEYFDAICAGMGEYTLDGLIRHFEENLPIKEIPNLIYKDADGIHSNKFIQVNMDDIKTPVFEEERPNPILPIFSAAGCYWSRCKFCEYPYHHMNCSGVETKMSYYSRSVENTIDDIINLNNQYKPAFFFFCDSDIKPERLNDLADKIIDNNLDIHYFVWLRAEKEFLDIEFCRKLAKSGCFGVYMGLEAGAQRINDIMDKGIVVSDVEQVIRNFHSVGIIANIFCMIGTPTETREEAMLTKDFIMRNREYLNDISVSAYQLSAYSLVNTHREDFGIIAIYPKDDRLAAVYDYEIEEGLTQQESLEIRDEIRESLGADYINGKFIFDFIGKQYP